MYSNHNPIRSVDGSAVACPSSYQWKLQDISSPDAGRVESGDMSKMRIGQVVAIELSWQNISTETASAILRAFNPEYISVSYLDPMAGKYLTAEFYVGDRSAPLYSSRTGLWSNIAFNIIGRSAVSVSGDAYWKDKVTE